MAGPGAPGANGKVEVYGVLGVPLKVLQGDVVPVMQCGSYVNVPLTAMWGGCMWPVAWGAHYNAGQSQNILLIYNIIPGYIGVYPCTCLYIRSYYPFWKRSRSGICWVAVHIHIESLSQPGTTGCLIALFGRL